MTFVIATQHFAGLWFGVRLQDEGQEVLLAYRGIGDRRQEPRYALVGNGIVPKRSLDDVMREHARYHDAYFVWDENHSVDENETLRAERFRVLGGGRYPETMEHDRSECLDFVDRFGLKPPPSHAFVGAAGAITFLEEHANTAYVYKADRGENFETWLPRSDVASDANAELRQHLRTRGSSVPFVLQERKDGVETNVEVWFVEGEPTFAFMAIESKKLNADLGDLVGCAFHLEPTTPHRHSGDTKRSGRWPTSE